MIITIDGPAAAGKTTLARAIAGKFGFVRLDSGALYRALALHMREHPETEEIPTLDFASNGHILIDGADREADIRTPEIAMAASDLSRQAGVRTMVDAMLRRSASLHPDIVAEGRDMGTAVFPLAELKIFLTADIRIRAERRFRQAPLNSFDEVLRELAERDRNDSSREISPLRKASDAIRIDNTNMTVEETLRIVSEQAHVCIQKQ